MKLPFVFVALSFIAGSLSGQPGSIDFSFGQLGAVLTPVEGYSIDAESMALQPDGKILLAGAGSAGSDENIVVVRYLPDGQLDPTFAESGKLILSISEQRDRCYGILADSTGAIFLAGQTETEDFEIDGIVIKLTAAGLVDSSFAENGVWRSQVSAFQEDFRDLVLQEDGAILVSGRSTEFGEPTNAAVVRLLPTGTLDSLYGEHGYAYVPIPGNYQPGFAGLQQDGSLVAGGFNIEQTFNAVLFQLDQAGSPQPGFGTDGLVIEETNFDEAARDMVLLEDGKILLGTGVTIAGARDFGMLRYLPDGTLDDTFGNNGRVITDFGLQNTAHAIEMQEDGSILLCGFAGASPDHDYAIARYDTDGQLDGDWAEDGVVLTDLGEDDLLFMAALQPDGKLLCAGYSVLADDTGVFSMIRYLTRMETSASNLPAGLQAVQVYPNPCRENLTVELEAERPASVSFYLSDISGRVLETLAQAHLLAAGKNILSLEIGHHIKSGVYLLHLNSSEWSVVRRIVVQ